MANTALASTIRWYCLNKQIVLCHGCFDLFHYGHLIFLNKCRELGDKLIVTITADEYINKGHGRPLFTANQRKIILESLRQVDQVEIIDDSTAIPAILAHLPDIYCKGMDYINSDDEMLQLERQAVESYGGKLVILQTEGQWSSTEIMTGRTLTTREQSRLNHREG